MLVIDWSFLNEFRDVNLACHAFYTKLFEIVDAYVPQYITKKHKYPFWFSSVLKNCIQQKEYFYRRYKKYKNIDSLDNFKRLRSEAKTLADRDYKNYLANVAGDIKTDPKKFWSFINNKRGVSRIPGIMRDSENQEFNNPSDIVESFKKYFHSVFLQSNNTFDASRNFDIDINMPTISINGFSEIEIINSIKKLKNKMTCGPDLIPSFFVKDCAQVLAYPLQTIFNLSLRLGIFPDDWKTASVCPILKSGDPSCVQNYRPITLLCNFAKAFEISLYNRIYPHFKNIISPDQHGFMEKRSTNTNLICMTQFLSNVLDVQGQVDVVYTDFSKAFDRIDHNILLYKLSAYGFTANAVQLLKSYLSNRYNYVTYNGFKSGVYPITSGVPQGSNLGPLLFSLFVNDLNVSVTCNKLIFADDLKIYSSINSLHDCMALQNELNKVSQWCNSNKLQLNISKCKVISYTRKTNPILFHYNVDTEVLLRTDTTRDLGVCFDNKLSFSEHIQQTVSASLKRLGFVVRQGRVFEDNEVLIKLFFTFVRSKLEYCCLIWNPYYNYYNKLVESVQKKFLKFLAFHVDGVYPNRGCDYKELITRFNFNSLEFRRNFYSLKFLHSLLSNNIDCPQILNSVYFFTNRVASRTPRTFYCPIANTNVLLKSPVYSMACNYNKICTSCDIFHCNLKELYTTFSYISNT